MSGQQTEVIVVGAGPVGLFAVFQCGMAGLRCHVIDAQRQSGGQLSALYPDKPIYDIPGHPAILAADLVAALDAQAAPFAPVYHLGITATALAPTPEGGFRLSLPGGDTIEAGAVIVASGGGAFTPKRPPLDGLDRFEGNSVFYAVPRREALRGKRVVIAGGGDSAVDWAIVLADIAERVMVVHRRPRFRAAPVAEATLNRLAADGRIDLVVPYQLHALEGRGPQLDAVVVATLQGETRRLEADTLLAFYGLAGDSGAIAEWGLAMEGGAVTVDPATMATSRPGVFACGDIATYPGKLKLILTGFAEAARAARSAEARIHPGRVRHMEHSTTAGVPGASKAARG